MSGLLNFVSSGSATNTSGLGGLFASLFKAPSLYSKGEIFDNATAFAYGGGKMGVMGEAGPEAVVPLSRGRDGKLGIQGGSGGVRISNTVNNYGSKATARTEAREDGRGGIDIVTTVEDIVVKTLSGNKGQQILGAQYGLRQTARVR